MRCHDLTECFEHIRAYVDGKGTGYPLIVNTENFHDYQEIMQRFNADETKQCIFVSEHTYGNGLPNIQEVLEIIKSDGSYVVSGISQSLMLQGKDALDAEIDHLIGFPIHDHAIIMLCQCRTILEKYLNRDIRFTNRVILLDGVKSSLPQLRIAKTKEECMGNYNDGIKDLLAHLERMSDFEIDRHPTQYVITSFSEPFFKNSMFAVSTSGGIYDSLIKKYPDLAPATEKKNGTDEDWKWLYKQIGKYGTFSGVVSTLFGASTNLVAELEHVYDSGDEKLKWFHWLAMKVFGVGSNEYLAEAISHCNSYNELSHHIYQDLLDLSYDDREFEDFYKERKQLIARLPENLPEMNTYCKNVGRHGKDAVYYLTDASEDEEYTFMQTIDHYEWTNEELNKAINFAFPELALYMRDFVFDPLNTQLSYKDAAFRETLSDYFHHYKSQKIRNRIDDDFLDLVNEFAVTKPCAFYKLQPRSAIVTGMDKSKIQAYFFDALGVEYLSYIQAKCEEYGMIYEFHIGHCELPSITVKNKEFKHFFNTKDIADLDELKHHSQIYDYQTCEYPIHIFRELEIIDRELRRIRGQLIQNTIEKAVLLSDHGASRLAVIYKHESGSLLELEEKGVHSGRCCPCGEDPGIPQAVYEDGYAVLGNYERFKGSRKANLEVHGGATLEEVVVPVIILSLKPDNVVYSFINPVIKYKLGQMPTIELYSNAPMSNPRLEVEGTFYEGTFQKDKQHALFILTEQKRVREYSATVYEGNANTGVVLSFRIERNTKTRDLFG